MKRIGLTVAGAVVCLLADCTGAAGPPGERVDVTTLGMNSGGMATGSFAAISASPIHLGAFASWYGQGADEANFEEVAARAPDGSAYLAVTGQTGCREPEGVEVHRDGADLAVLFVGGTEHETCERPVGPGAYLALPAAAADGVRTVNGEPLLDPAGPGEPVDFVPLGDSRLDPVMPAEFGTEALNVLRRELFAARPDHAEQLSAALDRPVPDGKRVFAFVPAGCALESAVLVLDPDHVAADGIHPGVPVDCEVTAHYLATFEVDADDVPEGITLAG